MNKIFNKIMGFNSQPEHLSNLSRIKTSGKTVEALQELAKSKGLELYCDTLTKTYWIWKDGNSIDGTRDGFTRLPEVKEFLTKYNQFSAMTIDEMKSISVGITKLELALNLDSKDPLFNFSSETGPNSYKNYTRDELLSYCIKFGVDPLSDYQKSRQGLPVVSIKERIIKK